MSAVSFADDLSQQGPKACAEPRRSIVLQAFGQGSDSSASRSELPPQHQAQIAKRCAVIEIGRLDALGGGDLETAPKVLGVSLLCAHSPDECLHGQGPDRVG